MANELKITKEFGSYYCKRGDRIVWMADTVGIVFDGETGALLKIGPSDSARKYATFVRSSALGKICQISYLEGNRFEPSDLQHVLDCSGYAKELSRRLTMDS